MVWSWYGHGTIMVVIDHTPIRASGMVRSWCIIQILSRTNVYLFQQVSLGPEQAAIAQSQHFDELESLWNKVSPPRRRSNKVSYIPFTMNSHVLMNLFLEPYRALKVTDYVPFYFII